MTCKQIFPLIVSLLMVTVSFGQKSDFRSGTILQKNFCDTIPFEFVKNKIIIALKVNGVDKRFIFDTGSVLYRALK